MNLSQSLDVLIGIAGSLFILSVANEAILEFLKFVMDLKHWGPYSKTPSERAIGQRFWYPAVHTLLQSTAKQMMSAIDLKRPATPALAQARSERTAAVREALKQLLGANVAGADYAAEALANVSEQNVMAAVDAYIAAQQYGLSRNATPADVEAVRNRLQSARPGIVSLVAAGYRMKRKAVQNRQRGYSFLTGLSLAAVLFGLQVFSLFSLACLLTVDPAARAMAVNWFSDSSRVNQVAEKFHATEKQLEATVNGLEARRKALADNLQKEAGTKDVQDLIHQAGEVVDTFGKAPHTLTEGTLPALAGLPVGRKGFAAPDDSYRPCWARPQPVPEDPNKTERGLGWWIFTVLELLLTALVLTFGAENWHNILNALLEARRQFGEEGGKKQAGDAS